MTTPALLIVFGMFVCGHFLVGPVASDNFTSAVNPLDADDIIQNEQIPNLKSCERFCWYHRACRRFSFFPRRTGHANDNTCILHAGNLVDDWLEEGWKQSVATDESVNNGCKSRPCSNSQLCIPLRRRHPPFYFCHNLNVECPAPSFAGLNASHNGTKVGDTGKVTCAKSTFLWVPLEQSNTITCLVTGRWSAPLGSCKQAVWNEQIQPPAILIMPQRIVDTRDWTACIKGNFTGSAPPCSSSCFMGFVLFENYGEEDISTVMSVSFGYSQSSPDYETDETVIKWTATNSTGFTVVRDEIQGSLSLPVGQEFNLSICVPAARVDRKMTIYVNDEPSVTFDFLGNVPDLSRAEHFIFYGAALKYINLVSACDNGPTLLP